MSNKGVIYYKLESSYDGDFTKYCGLSGGEIDSNFLFLRGYDIERAEWDSFNNELVLYRLNGEKIIVSGFSNEISIDGTYYDSYRGVLVININGEEYEVSGFNVEADNVFSDSTLVGTGVMNNPLGVSNTLRTGFFAPAEAFVDLTVKGNQLPNNPDYGVRYLTREYISNYGHLFNFAAISVIEDILKKESSPWRIPTNEEWAEMLNALEICDEDRTHGNKQSNRYNGKYAGAYLKRDSFEWFKVETTTTSQESNGSILPSNNILPTPTYQIFYESSKNGDRYEISGTTKEGVVYYDQYVCRNPWNKCTNLDCECGLPYSSLTKSYNFKSLPAGYSGYMDKGVINHFGEVTGYWSKSQDKETDAWVRTIEYNKDTVRLQGEATDGFYSIRLVRDYVDNISDVEIINGLPYNTVLMPYVEVNENGSIIKEGKKVWIQQNLSIPSLLYPYPGQTAQALKVKNNEVENVDGSVKYFINFWNGKMWEKREFVNNDMIILSIGPDGKKDEEWQLSNGVLVRRSQEVSDAVLDEVKDLISEVDQKHDEDVNRIEKTIVEIKDNIKVIEGNISAITNSIQEINENIDDINNDISDLSSAITQEIEDRIKGDEELSSAITQEVEDRIQGDEELSQKLEDEIIERKANDIVFPPDEVVEISVINGGEIRTQGNEEHGIPSQKIKFVINANFGDLNNMTKKE